MNTPSTRTTLPGNVPATLSIAAHFSESRVVLHHPVLAGDRSFLRRLRAAEMAAWEAGLPLAEYQRIHQALAELDHE